MQRLKAAGAIPIGRTNLATFTVRWHCESELWGHTVNPWDASIADGLPEVVQIIGPRYRADLVLDTAAALEGALGVITPIDPR